ncbi:hypothetical protein D3C78_1478230 [compost metagenome]
MIYFILAFAILIFIPLKVIGVQRLIHLFLGMKLLGKSCKLGKTSGSLRLVILQELAVWLIPVVNVNIVKPVKGSFVQARAVQCGLMEVQKATVILKVDMLLT